jgi:hypothetical protein
MGRPTHPAGRARRCSTASWGWPSADRPLQPRCWRRPERSRASTSHQSHPVLPPPAATLRVVQADGQGVPMVQPPTGGPPVRLAKGQKRPKKKDAVVMALDAVNPDQPTPQDDVVAALLQDASRPALATRPPPVDQDLRAPRASGGHALAGAASGPARRASQPRWALTAGAEALPQPIVPHLPERTQVLDIIHATESLSDTAPALRGEPQPQCLAWVRVYREPLCWRSRRTPSERRWRLKGTIPRIR